MTTYLKPKPFKRLLQISPTTNYNITNTLISLTNNSRVNVWKTISNSFQTSTPLASNHCNKGNNSTTTLHLRHNTQHRSGSSSSSIQLLKPGVSSIVLRPHHQQQQIRNFQTYYSSRCFAAARGPPPQSDVMTKSVFECSDATADVIQRNGEVFGDSYTFPGGVDGGIHDACEELGNEQFTNHRLAYDSKTTLELARTSFFYFIFRYKLFTEYSEKIMHYMKKVLGERISDFILKKTIYDQYVAGETNDEIQHVISRLQKEGVGPLIAVPIEDDCPSDGQNYDKEEILDQNCSKILKCMNLVMDVAGSNPMFQLRVTALMSPKLIKMLSAACSVNENGDCDAISMEAVNALVQGIRGKPMDIPKTKEWEQVELHMQELNNVLGRVRSITERISETKNVAMVDAEYTYFNPAIRHLTYAMMEICSKDRPLVFYTYQAYLKKTYDYLKSDLNLAKTRGVCFGAKMVRGAYIVKERNRAQAEGYPDPVNDDLEATSKAYQYCLDALLSTASQNEDRIRFIIATHNEDSVRYAFKRMSSLGLPVDSKAILFGQLFGMADHVSYTLGKKGCNVVKSLPYGSVDDTVPYLARRAHENRSIFDNVRKEKMLVKKALWERLLRTS